MTSLSRNNAKNPTQMQLAWEMLEAGSSVTAIAKELGLTFDTLRRRLLREDTNRHRNLAQRNCHLWGRCYSTFEQTVRDSLNAQKVGYGFHVKLSVEKHYYIADFLIGQTILEVTGMKTRSYWERTKEKLNAYLRCGRKVILVIGQKRKWMENYIPQHENLVVNEIDEFTANTSNILEDAMDTPIRKMSAKRQKN